MTLLVVPIFRDYIEMVYVPNSLWRRNDQFSRKIGSKHLYETFKNCCRSSDDKHRSADRRLTLFPRQTPTEYLRTAALTLTNPALCIYNKTDEAAPYFAQLICINFMVNSTLHLHFHVILWGNELNLSAATGYGPGDQKTFVDFGFLCFQIQLFLYAKLRRIELNFRLTYLEVKYVRVTPQIIIYEQLLELQNWLDLK